MKYKITDNFNNHYNLEIGDIINLIKNNPEKVFFKIINQSNHKINSKLVLNTRFICHRINTIDKLINIDNQFGIELDVRDDHKSNKLILSHDPFVHGEYLEEYLKQYNHNTLILNIKSERVEIECLQLLKKYNIENFFFLDSSFPMIYLLYNKYNCSDSACRFSEFENINVFLDNKKMFSTLWIDCFTKFPLNNEIFDLIKNEHKKICIVSPELQKQPEKIQEYRDYIITNNIIPDMICTKYENIIKWI
uniref:Uncharacterized protein n=1 Tax=Florenciella sp. virus SA2 TaxID=3240092 RepID=A0AB39JFX2_9VIRU